MSGVDKDVVDGGSRFGLVLKSSRFRVCVFFFFQAEDGIRDYKVTGVQTCALPICYRVRKTGLQHGDAADLPVADHLTQRAAAAREFASWSERQQIGCRKVHAVKIGRASCRERV